MSAALLLTHLHSDHIADLGDLLITRWVTTFAPGTAAVVEATPKAYGPDISYRIAHHDDLTAPPAAGVRPRPQATPTPRLVRPA